MVNDDNETGAADVAKLPPRLTQRGGLQGGLSATQWTWHVTT
jgi:hypothetical protein